MIYGYASSLIHAGRFESQLHSITEYYPRGIATFTEVLPAKSGDGIGPDMKTILGRIHAGDTFVATEVRRLARTREDAWMVYTDLVSKGVKVNFLYSPFLNDDIVRKSYEAYSPALKEEMTFRQFLEGDVFIRNLFDYQFDKFNIAVESRKAGRLMQSMRKPAITKSVAVTSRFYECRDYILANSASFDGTMKDKDLIPHLAIGRDTFYRYKKLLLAQREQDRSTQDEPEN